MKKMLVILGPTATGKTNIALMLAKKFNGELVSCDSRQVYKGLNIGTGKDLNDNSKFKLQNLKLQFKNQEFQIGYHLINNIPVWMLDLVSPDKQYNVSDYVEHARIVIRNIENRNKLPVIVGGTGLYLKALIDGLPNLSIPVDEELRRELEKLSLLDLQKKLQELSFSKWESLNSSDRQNPRRLLRSIELVSMNPYINKQKINDINTQKYDVLKIGLTAPREILNKRIDARIISRINEGMIEETKNLHKKGLTFIRMKKMGLEYGLLADLLKGSINKEEFIKRLEFQIHRYAKRQMTWFKKEKNILWFDITKENWQEKMEKTVLRWYH
jgi:tRNA dimethylallyltransferase